LKSFFASVLRLIRPRLSRSAAVLAFEYEALCFEAVRIWLP
jgi:hypothetical protein